MEVTISNLVMAMLPMDSKKMDSEAELCILVVEGMG